MLRLTRSAATSSGPAFYATLVEELRALRRRHLALGLLLQARRSQRGGPFDFGLRLGLGLGLGLPGDRDTTDQLHFAKP